MGCSAVLGGSGRLTKYTYKPKNAIIINLVIKTPDHPSSRVESATSRWQRAPMKRDIFSIPPHTGLLSRNLN